AVCSVFFFFQAEDGIRDWSVTGVQTCALPICLGFDASVSDGGTGTSGSLNDLWSFDPASGQWTWVSGALAINAGGQYGTQGTGRSEERRVGKEWRCRGAA